MRSALSPPFRKRMVEVSFYDPGTSVRFRHRVRKRASTCAPGSTFFRPEYLTPSGPGAVLLIRASLLAASSGLMVLIMRSFSNSLEGSEKFGTSLGGSTQWWSDPANIEER